MRINHDIHVHTYLSECCHEKERQTPAAILALAEQMGVGTIGFADHMWLNPDLEPSDWYRPQDESQLTRLRGDLADISTPVRVLVGCEAEMIAPGKFGITRQFAEALDFVLLACDHFHMKDFVEQPPSDGPRDIARHMLKFFLSAVTSGLPTSIAHSFMPCGYEGQYDNAIAATSGVEFFDAFAVAAERGVGIEVTRAFLPSPTDGTFSIETPIRVLTIAKQAGCKFTFGTDAHDPEGQKCLPELEQLTTAVGITEEDILPMLRTE